MQGSYAPNTDKQTTYVKKCMYQPVFKTRQYPVKNSCLQYPIVQEEEAPSGMLARGHYNAVSSFVDDDKKKHLEFEWSFDIGKDW